METSISQIPVLFVLPSQTLKNGKVSYEVNTCHQALIDVTSEELLTLKPVIDEYHRLQLMLIERLHGFKSLT